MSMRKVRWTGLGVLVLTVMAIAIGDVATASSKYSTARNNPAICGTGQFSPQDYAYVTKCLRTRFQHNFGGLYIGSPNGVGPSLTVVEVHRTPSLAAAAEDGLRGIHVTFTLSSRTFAALEKVVHEVLRRRPALAKAGTRLLSVSVTAKQNDVTATVAAKSQHARALLFFKKHFPKVVKVHFTSPATASKPTHVTLAPSSIPSNGVNLRTKLDLLPLPPRTSSGSFLSSSVAIANGKTYARNNTGSTVTDLPVTAVLADVTEPSSTSSKGQKSTSQIVDVPSWVLYYPHHPERFPEDLNGQTAWVTFTGVVVLVNALTGKEYFNMLVITPAPTITTGPPTDTTPTVVTPSPRNGFEVAAPQDWMFSDLSYPSDHATYLLGDPNTPSSRMEVVASGCAGCAMLPLTGPGPNTHLTTSTPDVEAVVPSGAQNVVLLSACRATYTMPPGSSGATLAYSTTTSGKLTRPDNYPDVGEIFVTKGTGRVAGFIAVQVWLPNSDASLAMRMAASFQFTGKGTETDTC
jgi:hypothetical protein